MATRKRTLRNLPPVTRKLIRLCDELESVERRLRNMRATIEDLELVARAEEARRRFQVQQAQQNQEQE